MSGDGPLRLVAVINLGGADVEAFEAYERIALPLAQSYRARVGPTLRSRDGALEIHVLHFPSRVSLSAFREAPARVAAQGLLTRSRALIEVHEVEPVDYLPVAAPFRRLALTLRRLLRTSQVRSRPSRSTGRSDVDGMSDHMRRDMGLPRSDHRSRLWPWL